MLYEAELFEMAETMLVEVLGRIRPEDQTIGLPTMFSGDALGGTAFRGTALTGSAQPMAQALQQYLRDDVLVARVLVARVLAGPGADPTDRGAGVEIRGADLRGAEIAVADIAEVAQQACHAAAQVVEGDAAVPGSDGQLTVRDFLLRSTVERSLLAHYVAAYLGSTACPLPEELARPLWELTSPEAAAWRALGYFREPIPLPPVHVSWRDRFLMMAGHEPHPLGH